VSFQISPLTFCSDLDEHLLREPPLTFKDYTRWGLFLEPQGRIIFSPVKWLEFHLQTAYRHIGEGKGEGFEKEGIGKFQRVENDAGTGLSLLNSSIMAKIRF
jgi:hypothetical protein